MERDIREVIKERYGAAAKQAAGGKKSSCCGSGGASNASPQSSASSCCGPEAKAVELGSTDPICNNLYAEADTSGLPEEALLASFGCGNPTALAELAEGEVVLDLGSGGGIDVLLSARRVGPSGKAYGLDMTDEMLELARRNQTTAGVDNVEFLKGSIESVPLDDASIDVIISNCVINLSSDKDRVLREAFRVLKPGGRFAVSDMVLRRELPDEVRRSVNLWTGCVAGALVESDYRAKLEAAGFTDIDIETTRTFSREDAREMAGSSRDCAPAAEALDAMAESVISAFVRARKP